MRILLTSLLIVLLTACGSSPTVSYYLIDSLPAPEGVHAQTGPIIGIERMTLPGYLEASAILQRRGDQRLSVNESERWGEALPNAIARVLSANLMALLPEHRVVRQPWSHQQQPDARLTLSVQELLAHDDGSVVLSAQWQLARGDDVLSRQGHFRAALTNNRADGIARAHGEVLEQLARAIAADITPSE